MKVFPQSNYSSKKKSKYSQTEANPVKKRISIQERKMGKTKYTEYQWDSKECEKTYDREANNTIKTRLGREKRTQRMTDSLLETSNSNMIVNSKEIAYLLAGILAANCKL